MKVRLEILEGVAVLQAQHESSLDRQTRGFLEKLLSMPDLAPESTSRIRAATPVKVPVKMLLSRPATT